MIFSIPFPRSIANPVGFAALLLLCLCQANGQESIPTSSTHSPADIVAEGFPDWAAEEAVNLDVSPEEAEEAGSTYFLLSNRQFDVESHTRFNHYVKRFNTESGLQDGSQLEVSFDPSYQKLKFHRLKIHRDGKAIDLLPTQEFKLIQREEDHDRQLYDSSLSAIAVIKDTRVEDLIEYAYSIEGANPVFNGNVYWNLTVDYTVPIGVISGAVRAPANSNLLIRSHETKIKPRLSTRDNYETYHWRVNSPAPLISEGGIPDDYDPWGWIEVSSYQSWKDVVKWAQEKYATPDELPLELIQEIKAIKKLDSPQDQIVSALRYVQDEIRYLGLFEGVHTHQPYPIKTILERRFGDCKDKSLMLTTMLRELGFEAYPALVETDYRHAISEWTPSPSAFNHLVVALEFNGQRYWLDPTRSYQRGKLEELYFPDYGYALIVRDETDSLTKIGQQGFDSAKTRITESFELDDYTGLAELKVTTVYHGSHADSTRSYFASTQKGRIAQSYLNYYADNYEDIEIIGRPEFVDDEEANTITVTEEYIIPNIWEPREGDDSFLDAQFHSNYVYDEIGIPSTKNRKMPFAVDYPVDVRHDVTVRLPHAMTEEDVTIQIDDPAFEFNYQERFTGDETKLLFTYQSKADRVAANRMGQYLKNAREAENNTSYSIWITRDLHEGNTPVNAINPIQVNWPILISLFFCFIIGTLASILIYYWDPAPRSALLSNPDLKGIGGWLYLPAIRVCIQPPIYLALCIVAIIENDVPSWNYLTSSGGEEYHVLWAPILMLESGSFAMLFPISIITAFLFFTKRTCLPRVMIALLGFDVINSLLFLALVYLCVGSGNELLPDYIRDITFSVFAAAIWIPYFLVSVRSATTFRRQRDGSGAALPPSLPPAPTIKAEDISLPVESPPAP